MVAYLGLLSCAGGRYKQYIILAYMAVSVVLSQSPARKERQKLDITLDSIVFVCRGKEI